jgi:hypothetical protein
MYSNFFNYKIFSQKKLKKIQKCANNMRNKYYNPYLCEKNACK